MQHMRASRLVRRDFPAPPERRFEDALNRAIGGGYLARASTPRPGLWLTVKVAPVCYRGAPRAL
jgi:hypothetical protein